MIVEDLFANVPARMKFLKKDSTEAGYISDLMTRLALSKPNISFDYICDGKPVFKTSGDGDLTNVILKVYGLDVYKRQVRTYDIYIIVDPFNYGVTYNMYGAEHPMSPDDHYQDLKRVISALGGKPKRITVIMPMMYEGKMCIRDSSYTGDIIGDINKRRGQMLGMEPVGDGITMIAVSYTHLDVYKRQGVLTALLSMQLRRLLRERKLCSAVTLDVIRWGTPNLLI